MTRKERKQAQRGNTAASRYRHYGTAPKCNWVKKREIDEGVTRGSLNFKRNWYDWFFFSTSSLSGSFACDAYVLKHGGAWIEGEVLVECTWVYLKDFGEVKWDWRIVGEQLYFFCLMCCRGASEEGLACRWDQKAGGAKLNYYNRKECERVEFCFQYCL